MSSPWPPLLEPDVAFVGRAMSVEEWLLLSEDEAGEIVGRLVEEEMPDAVHELAVSWFIGVLRRGSVRRDSSSGRTSSSSRHRGPASSPT